MNFRDFRIGWRLLIQQPAYSAVVVLGLSVGFAVCFLLLGFVRYSLSYDSAVPQADRIYLIENKFNIIGKAAWYERTPLPFLDVAQRSGLVESGTAVASQQVPFKVDNHVNQVDLLLVHPVFQQMFAVHPIEGDLQEALTRPDRLAVTESTARKLFGDTHVLGKTAQIKGKPYVVSAVLPDPPTNSTINYAALAGIDSAIWPDDDRNFLFSTWSNIGAKIYVKLKPGASPVALNQVLQDASDHSPFVSHLEPAVLQRLGQKKVMEIRIGALPDMYFDSATANTRGSSPHGDRRTVFGLAAVAVLILLLAATNYVNLATVRTLSRQREIAVRKVLGAAISRLVGQFLAESLLVALIATGLGLLLARLLLPVFSELVDRQLEHIFTPLSILFAIILGVAIGVAAGAYPAWVALHVRPPQTLAGRGSSETMGGLWLRRVLTVLQFSTAMALIGVTLAIAWQTHYASQVNPGFDPAPLLVVVLPDDMRNSSSRSLREALARLPGVTGVVASADPVGRKFIGSTSDLVRTDSSRASIVWRPVSANFFEVFGLRPVAGRLFDSKIDREDREKEKENVIVLNGAAVRALGYATPEAAIGQILTTGKDNDVAVLRVVGVAPDIRHESLHEMPQPIAYVPSMAFSSILTVRATGDVTTLESAADALARQYFPNDTIDIRRESSYFAENYADDLRLAKLLGLASVIAVTIAAFGIYVLSTYSVQRLSKQIVLRKLFGANHSDIARLVGREFIVLITVGALVGLPFAALVNERYLATFVERAPIGAWTLIAALLIALLVTLVSTLRQTVIALRMAPILILRE